MDHWLFARILFLIPLILCLSVHEWAHAWAAWKLGDDTAKQLDRMTLNPLSHIDPIGTLLLPLMGVPFGWAKPVPFNPIRFSRKIRLGTGTLLVAIAGPISNVVMAIGCVVLMVVAKAIDPTVFTRVPAFLLLMENLILLNVILAIFNMIPVPPLDGSHIADSLMPKSWRPAWDALAASGPLALFAVILVPMFCGINLFSWPILATQNLIQQILQW